MTSLTFGIELEFCVAALPLDSSDPQPNQRGRVVRIENDEFFSENDMEVDVTEVQAQLAETLNSDQIPATTDAREERRIIKARIADEGEELGEYKKWHISTDSGIKVPGHPRAGKNEYGYNWHKIEVKSPILGYSPTSLLDVDRVLTLLEVSHRTNINRSCGLHVHVGFGTQGIKIDTLKSVMALILAFEDILDTIHPPYRLNNPTCASLSRTSPLSRQTNPSTGDYLNSLQMAQRIFACRTADEVVDLLSMRAVDGIGAYQLTRLRERFQHMRNKQTIEFRQHEATFDIEKIHNWIHVCVAVVRCAENQMDDRLVGMIAHCDDADYGLEELLLDLGLKGQADYYCPPRLGELSRL